MNVMIKDRPRDLLGEPIFRLAAIHMIYVLPMGRFFRCDGGMKVDEQERTADAKIRLRHF
jgi:hypothetical protein